MHSNKILRRDNTPTEELQEVVKRTFEGIEFSYQAVYYMDYEVDEYTGMINKEKLSVSMSLYSQSIISYLEVSCLNNKQ